MIVGTLSTDPAASRLLGGRFELGEQLGAGGMARVHRATDVQLGRDVAVKLVDLRTDTDGQARSRVSREARRAAALRHPNVVQVHDVGTDDGHAYIVMEHIDGPTLADVRDRRGRLPDREVAELGIQICDALAAAHEAGIIHRDVKPGNILLDDGLVKVTDFGIARAVDDTLTDGMVRGTIGYLAPEQLSDGDIDHRADLYALGIVLYELATGRRPFEGATATETAFKRLHADPPAPSQHAAVSPAFDQVIDRALARDPDERFQTADELAAALRPLTRDADADTQPLAAAGGSEAAGRPISRRRGLLAAGMATVLLLAGAALLAPQLLSASSGQVPDLSGSTIRAAADLLGQHGLEIGDITRRVSDRPAGTVIDQNPPAGADAPEDGTIEVIVAQAPPSGDPNATATTNDPPAAEPGSAEQQPSRTDDEQPQEQQRPERDGDDGPPDGRGPDGQGPPGQDGPPGRD